MSKIVIAVIVLLLVGFLCWNYSKNKKAASANILKGAAFLEKNAQQEGVKTTASGLQYLVLQAGTGSQHPSAIDRVKVHYHGTLIDATVFDSSIDRGEAISFVLNLVIKSCT